MRTDLNIRLDLIRHGETDRNVNSDLIGQSPEEPLNETGKKQAEKLALRFKQDKMIYDGVYVSSYLRAQQTCKIACAAFPLGNPSIITVPDIREIFQGDGFNRSRKEVYAHLDLLNKINWEGMGFSFPNGESLYQVQYRTISWLNREILDNTQTRSDKPLHIAIFTHGMNVKCVLHHIMNFDHRMTWKIDVKNTSITSLHLKEGQWFIDAINDTSHLREKCE
jgi:broad specificity phosphatase PhoE